jgi:hypothetical protein
MDHCPSTLPDFTFTANFHAQQHHHDMSDINKHKMHASSSVGHADMIYADVNLLGEKTQQTKTH